MASNVLPKTFRNHDNLNCDRIFHAERQLSLIPLNWTAALPAALSNLTRPSCSFVFLRKHAHADCRTWSIAATLDRYSQRRHAHSSESITAFLRLMSTTKLDSTQQFFLTLLVALIQTVSLFANFDVPRSVNIQPCFFSLCSFLVCHFQVLQIQRA